MPPNNILWKHFFQPHHFHFPFCSSFLRPSAREKRIKIRRDEKECWFLWRHKSDADASFQQLVDLFGAFGSQQTRIIAGQTPAAAGSQGLPYKSQVLHTHTHTHVQYTYIAFILYMPTTRTPSSSIFHFFLLSGK